MGTPYDMGQPVGLDANQEKRIVGLTFRITEARISACGKDIPITSMEVEHLTREEFLSKYNFRPNQIGLKDPEILDILINKQQSTQACGEFADPGTHVLMSGSHAVIEIENDYFPLTKSTGTPRYSQAWPR